MDEEKLLLAPGYILLKHSARRRKKREARRARRTLIRETFRKRERNGIYHTLVQVVSHTQVAYLSNVCHICHRGLEIFVLLQRLFLPEKSNNNKKNML